MTLLDFIRSYLSLTTISKIIESRTPVSSLIFERIFKNRVLRGTDSISLAQFTRVTKSMPVISRGGKAIPIDSRNLANTRIEPLSIRLSDFITGAMLNTLKSLWGTGDENGQSLVKAELDRIVKDLMLSTELTRNALCAQAITGKINYQMESDNRKERYEIDLGSTLTETLDTKLDSGDATLVTLMNVLQKMKKKIADAGFSGTFEIMAGFNAFSTIANLIMHTKESDRMGAAINNNVINFMGFAIYLNSDTYTDCDASTGKEKTVDAVGSNCLVMYNPDHAELDYCAIDDVSGNLQATPFFVKTLVSEDPSGYKLISESKPMPIIAPEAICFAEITTSDGASIAKTASTEPDNTDGTEEST